MSETDLRYIQTKLDNSTFGSFTLKCNRLRMDKKTVLDKLIRLWLDGGITIE